MMLADKLLFPFAARMLLECAHVMNMSIVWTGMGVLVNTVPSAFLPERRERFPSESVRAMRGREGNQACAVLLSGDV